MHPTELTVENPDASLFSVRTDNGDVLLLQKAPALLKAESSSAHCGMVISDESDASENPWTLEDAAGRLIIRDNGRPVLAYNYEKQLPDGIDENYARSTYVHPVWDLSGNILTDDFPSDHYHHRGLSWMWPSVGIGDATYDLWHLRGIRQVFDEWTVTDSGPVCATIGAKNSWKLEEDGSIVMSERVLIRAFRATDVGRAIDVQLTLEAVDRPVSLRGQSNQGKGYGGLSLRFAPRRGTEITSPRGREEADSDDRRVHWADESGRFGGANERSGAAIFQDADNPSSPAAWTLRHYGFLGVAWPGLAGYTLQPGEQTTLKYRVWIHRGDAEEGEVRDAYRQFVTDPTIAETE